MGQAVLPDVRIDDTGVGNGFWVVTAFNNDHNTFDEVIAVLIKATGCTVQEAEIETWEIHHFGKTVVHHGSREECDRVGAIIASIGIQVTVTLE